MYQGTEYRSWRQRAIAKWCALAFGKEEAESLEQRGLRLFEETVEACQACNVDLAQLHHLLDFIYLRPVGQLTQELGGIGVCLLAMAEAAGVDADACEQQEVDRVLRKPIEHFRERDQAKDDAGVLAGGRTIDAES